MARTLTSQQLASKHISRKNKYIILREIKFSGHLVT